MGEEAEPRAAAPAAAALFKSPSEALVAIREDIGDMDDGARQDRPRRHTAAAWRSRERVPKRLSPLGGGVCQRRQVDQRSVEPEDGTLPGVAKPLR